MLWERNFFLLFDEEVGVAVRICTDCETDVEIADSGEHFDDVDEIAQAKCTCGNQVFRAATGFALDAQG